MPRHPRLFIANLPLHVVQRGHDRRPTFVRDGDYRYYLSNLAEAKERFDIAILGYCLMTNHIHLVVVPGDNANDVSAFMRVLAARQTRRINKLECRTGTLWDGRFKTSLIDTDAYLLACCRYVDLNPVRAGMVASPENYGWSSYRGRAGIECDRLLDDHDTFRALGSTALARAVAYRAFVAKGITDDELSHIRRALQRNQLTGDDRFKAEIEARIGRRLSSNAPGRPRKTRGRQDK